MKKAIYGLAILTLIFAASCKKTSSSSMSMTTNSSWTFKGTTYTGDTCQLHNGYFIAWPFSNSSNGYGTYNYIYLSFLNNTLPSDTGYYNVVTYDVLYAAPANNAIPLVVVNYIADSGAYISTGVAREKIHVSRSSSGKFMVTGNNVMIREQGPNGTELNDSATINFNLIQTF